MSLTSLFESYIDAVVPVHAAGVDALINRLGTDVVITFPALAVDCPNCVYDSLAKRSANIYVGGGPIPFTGGVCPYCNGVGTYNDVETQTLKALVIWSPQAWLKIPGLATVDWTKADTYCQVWFYATDLPAVVKADYLMVEGRRFTRSGEPCPQGFTNRYAVGMLKRT